MNCAERGKSELASTEKKREVESLFHILNLLVHNLYEMRKFMCLDKSIICRLVTRRREFFKVI
jgi:hypothetical protein